MNIWEHARRLTEALKLPPEQEQLASRFAGKLQQMAFHEHDFSLEDWKDVVRQIMASVMGEDVEHLGEAGDRDTVDAFQARGGKITKGPDRKVGPSINKYTATPGWQTRRKMNGQKRR